MELVYGLVGAGILVVAVLFLILRRKPLKPVSQKLSFDLLSGSQKIKKRKHFGFSKNKKKSDGEGESVKVERVPKDTHEKKGKKKGKNKGKVNVGGKSVLEVETQPEADSDNESVEIDEDNETDEATIMDQLDDLTSVKAGKSAGDSKSRSPKASVESKESFVAGNAPGKGNLADGQKETAGDKKGKKSKPRKEDENVVVKKESVLSSALKEKERVSVEKEDENEVSNSEEKDVAIADASGEKAAKKRKKKKKNGKASAANDEHSDVSSDAPVNLGSETVTAASNVIQLTKPEEGDEDSDEGFVPVSREAVHVKAPESNKSVKDEIEKPVLSNPVLDSVNALKSSLESEREKSRELLVELNKEKEQNGFFAKSIDQLKNQMQDKEVKRVQLERTLEQQKVDLKALRDQLQDSCVAIQQLKDENKGLKDSLSNTKHMAADDSVKLDLQTRVRVMDDALKQNALQMNASENARKDLEFKEKRHLEKISVLERELQVVKTELSENLQKSDQRCQGLSSELQRLTVEHSQVEKMRTHFMDLEKQKTELEILLQTKEAQNKELVAYRFQKDSDLQRMQSEMSLLNETFQRRSREMEARVTDREAQLDVVRQQLCQKDAELQRLQQKETEFVQKEAELQLLNQKGAEFLQKEVELQRLQHKEAEFTLKEVELQRFQQKMIEFSQKESDFIQKEMELQKAQQAVAELAQKEMEFATKEVELQRMQQALAEFIEREAEFAEKEVELQRVQHTLAEFSQKEVEFTQKEAEFQRAELAMAEFAQKEAGFRQKEAELLRLQQALAEFAEKEAELQRLQEIVASFAEKEVEFTQKEAELHRTQQELFAEKETEFTQKEVELQRLKQTVSDFVQKEAEFTQKEAELHGLRQKDVEFAQILKDCTHMAARILELEAKVAKCDQIEADLAKFSEVEGQVASCNLEIAQLHQKEADLMREVAQLNEELRTFEEAKFKMAGEVHQLSCDNQLKDERLTQLEGDKQDLVGKVLTLQTSLEERDRNSEGFSRTQTDLNERLEKAVLMQQELERQKRENTVLQDTIEQMKTELLQRLAASDAQLRLALDEKDKEIERLKSQRIATEEEATENNEAHTRDLQEEPGNQYQADGTEAQSFVDVDNSVIHDKH